MGLQTAARTRSTSSGFVDELLEHGRAAWANGGLARVGGLLHRVARPSLDIPRSARACATSRVFESGHPRRLAVERTDRGGARQPMGVGATDRAPRGFGGFTEHIQTRKGGCRIRDPGGGSRHPYDYRSPATARRHRSCACGRRGRRGVRFDAFQVGEYGARSYQKIRSENSPSALSHRLRSPAQAAPPRAAVLLVVVRRSRLHPSAAPARAIREPPSSSRSSSTHHRRSRPELNAAL